MPSARRGAKKNIGGIERFGIGTGIGSPVAETDLRRDNVGTILAIVGCEMDVQGIEIAT